MITIYDNDLPITVAQKIVDGTKPNHNELAKNINMIFNGTDSAEQDMFALEEIKEIADYLMVYYESHKEGD